MALMRYLFSILLLLFTCSALAKMELKAKQDTSNNGQKRLDIHGRYFNYSRVLKTVNYKYTHSLRFSKHRIVKQFDIIFKLCLERLLSILRHYYSMVFDIAI